MALAEDILDDIVERLRGAETDFEEWDLDALKREVTRVFGLDAETLELDFDDRTADEIRDAALGARSGRSYEEKEALVGRETAATASSATSCCRSSTRSGRITSTASTT